MPYNRNSADDLIKKRDVKAITKQIDFWFEHQYTGQAKFFIWYTGGISEQEVARLEQLYPDWKITFSAGDRDSGSGFWFKEIKDATE